MPSFAARLFALGKSPTDTELATLADDIALACAGKSKPRVAAATAVTWAGRRSSARVVARLKELLAERLAVAEPSPQASTNAARVARLAECYCGPADAARAYRVRMQTLLARVRYVRWRRLYGWAHWDGHGWQFPVDAIDPNTRGEFLTRQPSDEPEAHRRMLPDWCERVEGQGVAGAASPQDDAPLDDDA